MERYFNINVEFLGPTGLRFYSVDTPLGERVSGSINEAAARNLCDRLNGVLAEWGYLHGIEVDDVDRQLHEAHKHWRKQLELWQQDNLKSAD